MRQVKGDSRFGHPLLHFSLLHEERVEDGYVVGKHRDLELVLILRRRREGRREGGKEGEKSREGKKTMVSSENTNPKRVM